MFVSYLLTSIDYLYILSYVERSTLNTEKTMKINLSALFGSMDVSFSPSAFGFGYGGKSIKGIGCGGGRLWMSKMAALIANGRIDPSLIISHRFWGMESIPQAMDLFLKHDRSLIKPVIYNEEKKV